MDHNRLISYSLPPPMPHLTTLWINHNKIKGRSGWDDGITRWWRATDDCSRSCVPSWIFREKNAGDARDGEMKGTDQGDRLFVLSFIFV